MTVLVVFCGELLGAIASGHTQPDAVVALHITEHSTPHRCAEIQAIPCGGYVTLWPLRTPADLYLVVANGNYEPGIAGLSCGIMYNWGELGGPTRTDGVGIDLYSWTLCASGPEYPNGCTGQPEDLWPASGGGNRITWDPVTDCQRATYGRNGVQAVAGVFYVYAYHEDYLQVYDNANLPSGPEYMVIDCSGVETWMDPRLAPSCAFGDNPLLGLNPCQYTPVRATSWSRIKQRY